MNLLVPLAALLGIEVEAMTDRVKTMVIANAIIALFALVALVFLLIAGHLALSDLVGPLYSALIIAAAFLVLAVAVYVGLSIGESRRKKRLAEKRRSSETTTFLTTAALTALPVLLKSPLLRTWGLPAAALAAFLLVRNSSDGPDAD